MDTEYKFPKGVIIICICQALQQAAFIVIQDYYRSIFLHEFKMKTENIHKIENFSDFYGLESIVYLFTMILNPILGKFRATLYLKVIEILFLLFFYVPILVNPNAMIFMCAISLLLTKTLSKAVKLNLILMGSDEFILPQQVKFLKYYCSVCYFIINFVIALSPLYSYAGLIMSLRHWQKWKYYAVAVNIILSCATLCCFFAGRKFYKQYVKERKHFEVPRCIVYAIKNRKKVMSEEQRKSPIHWLDFAEDNCKKEAIEDLKMCLRILSLFFVIPFYWAVYFCQMIQWKLQAGHMKNILFDNVKLGEVELFYLNPCLLTILIPIFDAVIYPLLAKCHCFRTPLQRMTVGGIITAFSFFVCAAVELKLTESYEVSIKNGEGHVTIYNGIECDLDVKLPGIFNDTLIVERYNVLHQKKIPVNNMRDVSAILRSKCKRTRNIPLHTVFRLNEKTCSSYYVYTPGLPGTELTCILVDVQNRGVRPPKVMIRILFDLNNNKTCKARITNRYNEKIVELKSSKFMTPLFTMEQPTERMQLFVCGEFVAKFNLEDGGIYTIIINRHDYRYEYKLLTIVPPNRYHIFWLFPQYTMVAMGEIMFVISGIYFTLMQTPITMRTELMGFWFIAKSIGLLIYKGLRRIRLYSDTGTEFLVYGGVFILIMDTFIFFTFKYKYVAPESNHVDFHLVNFPQENTT